MNNYPEADRQKIVHILESLEYDHTVLDKKVTNKSKTRGCDQSEIVSLKRRKLELKDNIYILRKSLHWMKK